MRKLEKAMCEAVKEHRDWKGSNTEVWADGGRIRVYLFGNLIYKVDNGVASFTLAGWNTNTTRSRLNALGVCVCSRKFKAMYKGAGIDPQKWYHV